MTDDLDLRAARARDDLTRAVDRADPAPPPVVALARRAARRRARHAALAMAAVVTVGSGMFWAGLDDNSSKVVAGQPEEATTTTGPTPTALDTEAPPPIGLRAAGHAVDVASHTFCWIPADRRSPSAGLCADGLPPEQPPDIGRADEIEVAAPWASEITAFTHSPGQPCSRPFPVPVERQPAGRFRLRPAGYPGISDVRLSAKGPNGSAEYLFRWTTTLRGPLPQPSARASIVTGSVDPPAFGGLELAVDQLARTPAVASATVTVTAADGKSTTLVPVRAPDTCRPEGSVYWAGFAGQTPRSAPGPAPFRYDVTLLLDGVKHTATASWPDDLIVGFEPNVALHFDPPFKGLS